MNSRFFAHCRVCTPPKITDWLIYTESGLLVVASDGVFETMTSKTVCELAEAKRMNCEYWKSTPPPDPPIALGGGSVELNARKETVLATGNRTPSALSALIQVTNRLACTFSVLPSFHMWLWKYLTVLCSKIQSGCTVDYQVVWTCSSPNSSILSRKIERGLWCEWTPKLHGLPWLFHSFQRAQEKDSGE